jgi:predicted nuclease of predicted toxin-antitoxin system
MISIKDLKYLTDENIDVELLEFLREQGFDVFDIKEARLFRLSDRRILEMAYQEQRVVISQDSDFGTLIFRDNTPFWGIIYTLYGTLFSQSKIHQQR